jgi:hypothetical protein
MKKTERQNAESARDRLRKAEALIAQALADVSGVMTINAEAGDAVKANAAFAARGKLRAALAGLELAHAGATDLLLEHWPGFGSDVTTFGPGGR